MNIVIDYMVNCQCLKSDGHPCTRTGSSKAGDNPLYCWQHQKCSPKSQITARTRTEPRPTPRPAPRPTTRPTTRPTPRPTTRPTPRPTMRPASRPTPRSVSRPSRSSKIPIAKKESQTPATRPTPRKSQAPARQTLPISLPMPISIGIGKISILKTKSGKGLWVCGETEGYKDVLSGMGGKWNLSKKCWVFSLKHQEALLDLFGFHESDIGQQKAEPPAPQKIQIIKTASGKGLWVCGDTFAHKNKLSELNGKWNASKKCWTFSLKHQKDLLDFFNLQESDIGQQKSEK